MATKKKTDAVSETPTPRPSHTEAFDRAVTQFQAALELMHKGEFAEARTRFETVSQEPDEPALSERCRVWIRVCGRKLTGVPDEPSTPESLYRTAVLRINSGEADDAIALLDRALQSEPRSPSYLFARASAWASKGEADKAVEDLRQAIAGEPTLRFQAVNDPDFEPIREEPAFIDIIEPTPAGA